MYTVLFVVLYIQKSARLSLSSHIHLNQLEYFIVRVERSNFLEMPAAIQVLTADRAFKLMNFLQYLGTHLCQAGGGKPVSERERA
jgi:hypothetical protein